MASGWTRPSRVPVLPSRLSRCIAAA
jgi:hypothetical protein